MRRTSRTRLAAVLVAAFTLPTVVSAQESTQKDKKPMKHIVQVAVDAGSFKTLVAAVQAAGLAETLQGPGPFTVFAPTDAAFAKLPDGTVTALLADKEKLASILTFHVVSGKVMAADLIKSNGATPGRHLVVGHRNTTPDVVQKLGGEPGPAISDTEYDRFYVVVLTPEGPATVVLRYGSGR